MDYLNLSLLFSDTAMALYRFGGGLDYDSQPIKESMSEIEKLNDGFLDRSLLYQSITGINPDEVICSMRLGKTQDEAIKSQAPRIVILTNEELDVQLNLLSKELRDYKSISTERLENLIDFYCELSNNSRRIMHQDRMHLAA